MNGLPPSHTLFLQSGELIALVVLCIYALFSITITYHWIAFSPAKHMTAKFLLAYYGVSAVLFIAMFLSLTFF